MIIRICRCILIIFFCGACKQKKQVSNEETNAKWFFYAYALAQTGGNNSGLEVDPLKYDIQTKFVERMSADTTRFYFSLYQGDTMNVCYFKPYGLVGIVAVKKELYFPVYHGGGGGEPHDWLIAQMNKQDSVLLQKVLQGGSGINNWLKDEAKRKSVK